ncbi:MAG: response regulator [Calditrichia bacterium]|nr:response regulator [Calditrichia bacterium]
MEQINVLVVDDEQDVLQTLKSMLDELNFNPLIAQSGDKAMEIIENNRIDVVLSDIYMPETDGFELLKNVRAFDKEIVFLMITGKPTIETAVQSIREGAYDYITKPFDMEDLRIKINRCIEKKRLSHNLKWSRGVIWALIISIPIWLVLGIIFASILSN